MKDIMEKLDNLNRPRFIATISNIVSANAIDANVLVDTGAPYCYLTQEVIDFLKLEKISDVKSRAFMSEDMHGEYMANLNLDGASKFQFPFRVFNNKGDSTDCIIGTNLLRLFEFTYNNPKGFFLMKYIGL